LTHARYTIEDCATQPYELPYPDHGGTEKPALPDDAFAGEGVTGRDDVRHKEGLAPGSRTPSATARRAERARPGDELPRYHEAQAADASARGSSCGWAAQKMRPWPPRGGIAHDFNNILEASWANAEMSSSRPRGLAVQALRADVLTAANRARGWSTNLAYRPQPARKRVAGRSQPHRRRDAGARARLVDPASASSEAARHAGAGVRRRDAAASGRDEPVHERRFRRWREKVRCA